MVPFYTIIVFFMFACTAVRNDVQLVRSLPMNQSSLWEYYFSKSVWKYNSLHGRIQNIQVCAVWSSILFFSVRYGLVWRGLQANLSSSCRFGTCCHLLVGVLWNTECCSQVCAVGYGLSKWGQCTNWYGVIVALTRPIHTLAMCILPARLFY